MSDQTAVLLAIDQLAKGSAETGSVINVAYCASELLQRYPDAGLGMKEIGERLERAAVTQHAVIFSGECGSK